MKQPKDLNHYVSVYRALLEAGEVQIAYTELIKYVYKLKTALSKDLVDDFSVGNVFQGYMDYTYFYLTNSDLKDKKLKLAVVLNHAEVDFELWLLGQTKDVQNKYWNLLKDTRWVKAPKMPEYSIFEVKLINNPDFQDLDKLTDRIKSKFLAVSNEISVLLKQMHQNKA